MVEISIEFILGILGVSLAVWTLLKLRIHKARVLADTIVKFIDDYDNAIADNIISSDEVLLLTADARSIYLAAEDVISSFGPTPAMMKRARAK